MSRWTWTPGRLSAGTIEQLRAERREASSASFDAEKRRRDEGLAQARAAALPAAQRLLDRLNELDLKPDAETADDLVHPQWAHSADRPAVEVGCVLATVLLGPEHYPRGTWRILAVADHAENRVHVEDKERGGHRPRVYDLGPLTRELVARAVSDPPTALQDAECLTPAPPPAEPPSPAERARQLLDELDADSTNRHGQRGIALAQAWATLAAATT